MLHPMTSGYSKNTPPFDKKGKNPTFGPKQETNSTDSDLETALQWFPFKLNIGYKA